MMDRLRYTLWRFTIDIIGLFSRMLNAWVFGGSTSMTLSVRAHIEATFRGDAVWTRRRNLINSLFFWEDDHCARWWREDVERARYTLRLMGEDDEG